MVVTKDVNLPECSTLTMQEVNLSMATLMTAAPYIGKHCECVNNEFMLCRQELNDPRACLELGKRVTCCTLDLFRKIKANCLKEFNQHAKCIDKSSGDFQFKECRKTQNIFDCCMENKLCLERPEFGYFCRPRIHTTSSAPPPLPCCPCGQNYPDATPSLPDCAPRPCARFTSRFYWITE